MSSSYHHIRGTKTQERKKKDEFDELGRDHMHECTTKQVSIVSARARSV